MYASFERKHRMKIQIVGYLHKYVRRASMTAASHTQRPGALASSAKHHLGGIVVIRDAHRHWVEDLRLPTVRSEPGIQVNTRTHLSHVNPEPKQENQEMYLFLLLQASSRG